VAQVYFHNQEVSAELSLSKPEAPAETPAPSQPLVNPAQPEHLVNPSFLNSAEYNYNTRLAAKINYQFGFIGRGYVTFAIFILGLLVGRSRFLETAHLH